MFSLLVTGVEDIGPREQPERTNYRTYLSTVLSAGGGSYSPFQRSSDWQALFLGCAFPQGAQSDTKQHITSTGVQLPGIL